MQGQRVILKYKNLEQALIALINNLEKKLPITAIEANAQQLPQLP